MQQYVYQQFREKKLTSWKQHLWNISFFDLVYICRKFEFEDGIVKKLII